MDDDGGAGRRPGVQFGRAAQTTTGPGGKRGADRRQCRDADHIPEARPVAAPEELNAQLQRQGYYKAFPPEGVEVVSWYVMMGIGQVVMCGCRRRGWRIQPHPREHRLGQLPHRVLSDL